MPGRRGRIPARSATLAACAALLLGAAGCGRGHAPAGREPAERAPESREPARALPVTVFAATGRSTTLHVERPAATAAGPHAAVWLTSVSPARAEPAAQAPP